MIRSVDQTGQILEFSEIPLRVISVVPSQSEFLWGIGLRQDRLVGITKFCIHPKEMHVSINRVGGTKNLSIEKIKALKPDLIIANKEENELDAIIELKKYFPVWISDISTIDDSFYMMLEIGNLCGMKVETQQLLHRIESVRNDFLLFRKNQRETIRVAYFIWKNPDMVVGKSTFIDTMLCEAGFQNVFQEQERYPEISNEILETLKPQFIFLSTEPYPFNEKDVLWAIEKFPFARTKLVDGEMFSWYGSRMVRSYSYFRKLWNELR